MSTSAIDLSRAERVPHRWYVLQMLRVMRSGQPLIRVLGLSCLTYLDGVPLAVHFVGFLERNDYITPCASTGPRAHYYMLTSEGIELHESGERWWGSLRWEQKLRVIWKG